MMSRLISYAVLWTGLGLAAGQAVMAKRSLKGFGGWIVLCARWNHDLIRGLILTQLSVTKTRFPNHWADAQFWMIRKARNSKSIADSFHFSKLSSSALHGLVAGDPLSYETALNTFKIV